MGPEEAAYAVNEFFDRAQVIIPMSYDTWPHVSGKFEELKSQLDKHKRIISKEMRLINSKEELLGKLMRLYDG